MTQKVIIAEFRSPGRLVLLERVKAAQCPIYYQVSRFRKYNSADAAKVAYLKEVPESGQENQKQQIKNGLRFADERQNATKSKQRS